MDNYILIDRIPVPCENILEWSEWFAKADRHVGKTTVGKLEISTVFLGIDHSFSKVGNPILYETMVFGGEEEYQTRYCTWDQAEQGHNEIVMKLKNNEVLC